MKNKFPKNVAFLLAVIMAMNFNLPSGTLGIFDFLKTAFAADSITYTALEGTSGTNTSQSYDKLVDGNTSTKWCVSNFSSAYIIFKSSEMGYVKGYTMTTGNDTATQTSRNPEDWTLYGCNDYTSSGTGTWEVIHEVTGDEVLQAVNTTSFDFTCDQTAIPYQYFKLEITKNSGTDKYMQLSEFSLDIVSSQSQPTGDGSADNPYKIGTAAELYWFADKVNNDNANYKSANAVLTDDIIVNQNVLKEDGTLADNSSLFTSWTPIGNNSNKYSGTFDGKGYTVSGLYFNDTSINFVGLFGYNNNGTIKNVGIIDSYIRGNNYVGDVCGYNYGGTITNCYNAGTVSGGAYFVGGVCGYNYSATITNCYNTGKVSDASSIGGVCGYNNGTITNCYNTGTVSGSGSRIGGVCGENHRTITNCYYLADTEDENGGKTTAQFESGEVAYLLQSAQTAEDGIIPEIWGQTIGTENFPVLGGSKVYRNEIYTSYEGNEDEVTYYYSNTEKEPVYEEVSLTYTVKEGTSGANDSESYDKLIDGNTSTKWCVTSFSSAYIVIESSEPGFVKGYTMTTGNDTKTNTSRNPEDWTLYGCNDYTTKGTGTWEVIHQVTGDEVLQAVNTTSFDFTFDQTAIPYRYFKLEITKNSGTEKCMQLSEFALNLTPCQHIWVYSSSTNPECLNPGYNNYICSICGAERKFENLAPLGHNYDDGICTRCGVFNITQPDNGDGSADNPYQIAHYGHLVWFQQYVDSGNYSINAVLTADITANENLLNDSGKVSGIPKYTWTPITHSASNSSTCYSGTFDGQGHTISGLYAPKPSQNGYCGLFGRANGTIKNLIITDSYSGGELCCQAASIVGNGYSDCIIENCGSDASVEGSWYCGGIAGAFNGIIINCYFAGKVNSVNYTSNAIASDYDKVGSVKNCYYIDTCGLATSRATAKTAAEFASGEVCYKLNKGVIDDTQVWYQTIGTDSLPKFEGKAVGYYEAASPQYYNLCDVHQWSEAPTSIVAPTCTDDGYDIYTCTVCRLTKKVANGTTALGGHSYDDGVCTVCGGFTAAQPKNGDGSADNPYQIEHYGHLMWFQQFVHSGNYYINAVITADITANKHLLNNSGELSGTPEYTWTPITHNPDDYDYYNGVLDGQGHTISGLYVPPSSSSEYCGLFGKLEGTVKNLFITDSFFGGTYCENATTFVGYGYSQCVIENCGSDAVVESNYYCGGIAGQTEGEINNCYFAGKLNVSNQYSNAIASDYYDYGTLTNCYYLDTCGLASSRATAKTATEFASGEVCYLLNNGVTDGTQTWYQTIGTDALPRFEGRVVGYNETKDPQYFNACEGEHQWEDAPTSIVAPTCTEDGYGVYTCAVCGLTKRVVNAAALGHSLDDNGVCGVCDELVPVQPKNGNGSTDNPYQIANYSNLVWFQQRVDSGNYGTSAVLVADITANENLLNEKGEVSGTPKYKWTPILTVGHPAFYSGVFDGQGHTISGLYVPYSNHYCGLFGQVNGTIKNTFITDSYFGGSDCYHVGSFVGYGISSSVIENCGSDAVVRASTFGGGIAGLTYGQIKNCYFTGKIIGGYNSTSNAIASDYNNKGTLTNCYYLDTCGLSTSRATAKTAAEFASGEVCYKLNSGVTDGTQAWYQSLTTDAVPKFEGKTVYYSESAAPQYYNDTVTGDVNGNDTTDKADAALVLRYISSLGTLNAYQLAVADANGDGKVDMLDVIKILGLVG